MTSVNMDGLRLGAPRQMLSSIALDVGLIDGYQTYETPVGNVFVVFNENGVAAVELAEAGAIEKLQNRRGRPLVEARPPQAWGAHIERALAEGRPGRLPVDLRGVSDFRQKALRAATTIPLGQVRSYGWVANAVGSAGATRAVGSAMAQNPVPLIIPCHRVVRSDGLIGNYSLGGPDRKWELLRTEGADPDRLEVLAGRGIRYLGSDTTGIFCLPTCRHEKRTMTKHTVEFHSTKEAVAAGYRACKVCRPV